MNPTSTSNYNGGEKGDGIPPEHGGKHFVMQRHHCLGFILILLSHINNVDLVHQQQHEKPLFKIFFFLKKSDKGCIK